MGAAAAGVTRPCCQPEVDPVFRVLVPVLMSYLHYFAEAPRAGREGLSLTEDTVWAHSQSHHKIGWPHRDTRTSTAKGRGSGGSCSWAVGSQADGWGETGSGSGWVEGPPVQLSSLRILGEGGKGA